MKNRRDSMVDGTSWEFLKPAWLALHTVTIGALAYFTTKSITNK